MAVYVIVFMWQSLYVYFLNGVTKVRLQLILVIISSAANVPLAIYLSKIWGVAGVTVANIIVFVFMGTIFYIQTRKILADKATGIWIK